MLVKFCKVLAGVALLSGLGGVFSSPSYAGDVQFSCDTSGALPTTVATNAATGASLAVVRWYSEYFSGSGYDPLTRCQEVSGRFQRSYDNGSLDYITAGLVNGMPVICATSPGGSCNNSNMLFTLKPGTNAAVTLQRLFDVRAGAGDALYESSGRTYISLKKKLAPLAGRAGNNQPAANPSSGQRPASRPSQPGRVF